MIGHGLVLRDGDVELDDTAKPYDATTMLQVAAAAAHRDARIGMTTLELLGDHAPALDGPWPAAAREALVSLLGAGQQTVEVLEALDQYDLISRILPEWAAVRNKPQRNAFHTVHGRSPPDGGGGPGDTLHTARRPSRPAAHRRLAARSREGLPGRPHRRRRRTDGFVAGADGDRRADGLPSRRPGGARRPRAPPPAAASVATSRDLTDPATIAMVADAVGSVETLELLRFLTEADSLATGPSAWSPWKAGLIADLVRRVTDLLRDVPDECSRRSTTARRAW